MEYLIDLSNPAEIDLAPATEAAEILQNVRTILSTVRYSVPLDRGFGIDGSVVDLPILEAQAKMSNEIITALKRYEPRVSVSDMSFSADEKTGKLQVKVKVRL